jgi:Tol biopolymer transport system component
MAIMPATFAGRTLFAHDRDGMRKLFDLSTPDAPRTLEPVTTAFPPVVSFHRAIVGREKDNGLVLVKLDSNNPLPIPAPGAREPDLDRDRAVYLAHGEVFVTDLSSGVMRNISGALKTGTKYNPAISGDIAVWAADNGGAPHIYMTNVTTGGTPVEVSPTIPSPEQSRPRIDGDRIVWTDGAKIFTVTIDPKPNPPVLVGGTFKEIQPASGTYDNPDVYVSGSSMRVVFERKDGDKDIYLYDEGGTLCPTTDKICQVTNTAAPIRESSPSISNDVVVWLDGRVSDTQRQIYAYRLATGAFGSNGKPINPQAPISTRLRTSFGAPPEWDRASVRIDGRRIVWADSRNGLATSDIFLFDLDLDLDYSMEVRIAGEGSTLSYPSVSGNRVVYIETTSAGILIPRVWEYNPNP